jgi:hypothetical protein
MSAIDVVLYGSVVNDGGDDFWLGISAKRLD